MRLFVIRHGKSPTTSEAGVSSDAERPLSDKGRSDIERTSREILGRKDPVEVLLTSPLRRARQTGDILSICLKPKVGPKILHGLDGSLSAAELWEAMAKPLWGVDVAVVVGHMPQVAELTHYLTGTMSPGFRPGSCRELTIGELDEDASGAGVSGVPGGDPRGGRPAGGAP